MKNIQLIIALATLLTLGFKVPEKKPFNINDYSWLTGSWIGDGFGGTSEEIWSPPNKGTMMGMYRHHNKDGELVFYEFMLLDESGMKIKHFNADMSAWEDTEKFINFEMVEYSADMIILKGLTFERKSDNEVEIRLKMHYGEDIRTEVFNLKRVD